MVQPSLCERIQSVSGGPLLRTHHLDDHRREALQPPRRGCPALSWVVGVGADGTLVRHCFSTASAAHMLICGSTGTGKANLMSLMLCQLMHATSPTDVRFWLVDFQGEIADFEHALHVERYIHPAVSFGNEGQDAFADLLEDAATLVADRERSLDGCMGARLVHARRQAAMGHRPQRLQRPLMPSLILVIQNTRTFPGVDTGPRGPHWHTESSLGWFRYIVEHGPRVGVRVAALTEVPLRLMRQDAVLRDDATVFAMSTVSVMASMWWLGEPGLEHVDPGRRYPGRGVMVDSAAATQFRALFLGRPGRGWVEARNDLIAGLPRRRGPVPPG